MNDKKMTGKELFGMTGQELFDEGVKQLGHPRGVVTSNNYSIGIRKLFEKSADLGYVPAYYKLGCIHMRISKEYKWSRKSEEKIAMSYFETGYYKGCIDCLKWLADMYAEGQPFSNYNEAFKLYRIGADKGDCECQYKLGNLHQKFREYVDAKFWWSKAAEQKKNRRYSGYAQDAIKKNCKPDRYSAKQYTDGSGVGVITIVIILIFIALLASAGG